MRQFCAVLAAVLVSAVMLVVTSTPAGAAPATGVIAGSVDDITSGAPVPGVCVYAYAANGQPGSLASTGAAYSAVTEGDGSYEATVAVANYVVEFDPSCGGTVSSPYALQYYMGQLDAEDANQVFASAINPATGIDAHLVAGYSISGTVTEPAGTEGAAPVCVSADDSAGHAVNNAKTAADGTYTISNLPAGSYDVYFDPTCGGAQASTYARQYYEADPDAKGATTVKLQGSATGIDAQLSAGGSISGTVTALGAADYAGFCVYAIDADGSTTGRAVTQASGEYEVDNLPAETYTVQFDPTCSHSAESFFAPQTYGEGLALAAGETVPGIDATLGLAPDAGPPPTIRSSFPPGSVAASYTEDLNLLGPESQTSQYRLSETGLPPGLSLGFQDNEYINTAAVFGTPTKAGTFRATITVETVPPPAPPLVLARSFTFVIEPPAPHISIDTTVVRLSGKYLLVPLGCQYATCSGSAQVTVAVVPPGPNDGVPPPEKLAAEASYSIKRGGATIVRLRLTAAGMKALANAKADPVDGDATVTVRGGLKATGTVIIS